MARLPAPSVVDRATLEVSGLKIRYHPRGAAQAVFHDRSDEILLSGPAGTGKSLACLHKAHLVLSKYPTAKAFMARKTRSSMTDSCMATFERHVLRPPDKVHFLKQDQHYNYPTGSIFAVVGLDNPEKIKSTDWDLGYCQEVTECMENDWEICTTRLRNWVVPYQQMLADCNPDKPTHWIKRRCDQGLTKKLDSFHRDNPRLWNETEQAWTTEGQQYMAKLARLTGVRRSRLFEGKWVAAEGMVFTQYDDNVHRITLAQMPEDWEHWTHYWALDWGFTHPMVWQDWVEHPVTGDLFRVRELYHTKLLVEDAAKLIMEVTSGIHVPHAIICDHDAGDRATFERHTGYLTLPAYKIITQGLQAMQKRLGGGDVGPPRLFYVRDAGILTDRELQDAGKPTCTEEEFDGYVWDEKLNRLVNSKKDELPIDKDNHGLDASRYLVAFVDSLADDPEDIEGVLLYDGEESISPY